MRRTTLVPLALMSVMALAEAGQPTGGPDDPVPVTAEPLHQVQHRGEHFLVYTNWIEPGVWTLYHQHRNDLMAVIAADTRAASQQPEAAPREQEGPAGSVIFFPYADSAQAYVHRVGATGNTPFVNVGLEFLDPPSLACDTEALTWYEPSAQPLEPNRRGRAYRLALPADTRIDLPRSGRGLLLVPLGRATLELDREAWPAVTGDFRFYETPPTSLRNAGEAPATLVVFLAC
jgi:hypothetical protein